MSAHPKSSPEQYVRGITQEIISIIQNPAITYAQRQQAFNNLFLKHAAIRRTGLFLLGPYARRMSPAARKEYLALLPRYIATLYFSRLPHNLPHVQYAIKNTQAKGARGREFIVYGEVLFEGGRPPLPINWWLVRRPNGHYQVFDISAAGIWLAQEQRAAFTSLIRGAGGNPDALLKHIKARLAQPPPQNPYDISPSNFP